MPKLSPLLHVHLSENCKMYYITCIATNKWGWWRKPNNYPYQFIIIKTCKWEFYFIADIRTTSKHTIFAILSTTSFLTRQNNTVELSTMNRNGFLMYIVLGCGIVVCTIIVFQCLTIIRKKIAKDHRQRSREGEPQDPVYSEIML